ncbi:MAG: acetate--CoA ligase [Euryarchaeota archaeon]|nr:acetate--CoA ligase [Euryarchaeota archaeon]
MPAKDTIESVSREGEVFEPPEEFRKTALIKSMEEYRALQEQAEEDFEGFWARQAGIDWFKKWDRVVNCDFTVPYIRFYEGGKLNASYNCIDRHLDGPRRNKAALIWQGENHLQRKVFTYLQLHREVCRLANVLKKYGIKKGDRVTLFMPMEPRLVIAMLACARIGAIHSVVFSAFSPDALKSRIQDAGSRMLITTDVAYHAGKVMHLKERADEVLHQCPTVEKVIVRNLGDAEVPMQEGRDLWWDDETYKDDIKDECPPEPMDAEDPLFTLYTSGSTGKPKGILHTTGGYMVYANMTFRYIFDIKDTDIFWCTADVGWITGHTYMVYGPLSAGATVLMFEGVPTYPRPDRYWRIIDRHKVSIFYTAPTAIRALMKLGDEWPNKYDLSSLRLLGTVGEPINPEAWMWFHKVIGRERCPIVDTWWQTETGGVLITPLPGATPLKPGSATLPFPGVFPDVVREDGTPAGPNEGGYLVFTKPWPGMLRGIWGDENNGRFKEIYFSRFPGKYFAGDAARKDEDGYYWIMGRVDDVINVSGHRLGTAEIESALVSHEAVAEAAVIGVPDPVKGQAIYCFVTLKEGYEGTEELKKQLVGHVRAEISPIATPHYIQFAPALPKTRSGKIMRRILKKIATGRTDEIGDTSTLADPWVLRALSEGRLELKK